MTVSGGWGLGHWPDTQGGGGWFSTLLPGGKRPTGPKGLSPWAREEEAMVTGGSSSFSKDSHPGRPPLPSLCWGMGQLWGTELGLGVQGVWMTTHRLHILLRRKPSPCAGDTASQAGSDISTSLSWPSPGPVPPAEPSGEFSDLGKCPGKHSDAPTPDLCCFQVSMFAEPDSWWVLGCPHCQAPAL